MKPIRLISMLLSISMSVSIAIHMHFIGLQAQHEVKINQSHQKQLKSMMFEQTMFALRVRCKSATNYSDSCNLHDIRGVQ